MLSIRFAAGRRVTMFAVLALAGAALVATAPASTAASSTASDWPMFGQGIKNNASATSTTIGTANVSKLAPKWVFTTHGDVSARAAVVNGVAYFPDWGGYLYAVNASTGKQIWSKFILDDYLQGVPLGSPSKVVSRTSPFLDTSTNTLYVGTQSGAFLLAINASTGALRWRTQLDSHPLAIDTASPVVFQGVVYLGVASLEEAASANKDYPCCSFRGSAVAVSAKNGAILWKTYMVPEGYTGGSVWGSTVVPDPQRNQVYVTTGNNYSVPTDPAYTACIANGGTSETCNSPADHFDSVLALNATTGAINWADRFASSDDWNVACIQAPGIDPDNCPKGAGPDYDFGSGVQLMTIQTSSGPKTVIGAGQKSGIYSELDPTTGQLLWATQVGPGSSLGGMEWGSAADGKRIYVQIANVGFQPYSNPALGNAGSYAALDEASGKILWQVPDPGSWIDLGPMTVGNGVVYASSMSYFGTPTMLALDAATGATLWGFNPGSSVNAGASLAQNMVFWGSGYSNLGTGLGTPNNKFFAFSLDGK